MQNDGPADFSEVPSGIISWFKQRSVNNGVTINGLRNYDPSASIKNIDNELTLEPDWAAAVSYKKGDSTISEVPVKMKGRIAFSTSSMIQSCLIFLNPPVLPNSCLLKRPIKHAAYI